jgi:protein TonB
MRKLGSMLTSAALHGAAAATIALVAVSWRVEPAAVSIAAPAFVATDVREPAADDPVRFDRPEHAPRLEPEDAPMDFVPDRREDAIPVDPPSLARRDRPEPELRPRVTFEKLVAAQATAETAVELHNPPPQYPASARRRGIEGEVLVTVRITADGACADARVAESSGSAALDGAALEAVQGWRYRPATRGGRPVETTQRVRFVFKLKG